MAALKYWVWISSLPEIGAKSAGRAVEHFGSPERAFFARREEIERLDFLKSAEKSALLNKNLRRAERITEDCALLGIRIITLSDAVYPERLKNIFDPPLVLYIKGTMPTVDEEIVISAVGTRRCSDYGVRNAARMGYELASLGAIVASGLASGIDSAFMTGALRAGGRVIGVLGNGIDVIYPRENAELYERTAANGVLISEYPPGTRPYGSNFPVRNRIISGLSLGTLVVEAPSRSGALITASRALEQGRDVFAMPANVDSEQSFGSNKLLREGAIVALQGADIVREYAALYPDKIITNPKPVSDADTYCIPKKEREIKENISDGGGKATKKPIDKRDKEDYIVLKKKPDDMSDDEFTVLSVLNEQLQADEIVEITRLPSERVLSALTMLEIGGYVKRLPGKRFSASVSVINEQK